MMRISKLSKLTALFLSLVVLLSAFPIPALAEQTDWKAKIDPVLLEKMEDASGGDLIPVYIFRKNIDFQVVGERLKSEKGYDMEVYENEARFNEEILPRIAQPVIDEAGYEEACRKVTPQEIRRMEETADSENPYRSPNPFASLVDEAVRDEIKLYRSARLSVVRDECVKSVDRFLTENVRKDRKIIYQGKYSTTVIIDATKKEIENYAKLSGVEHIVLYEDLPVVPTTDIALQQVGVEGAAGTKSTYGFDGTGVTVGVIEAWGRYDPAAPQLAGPHSTGQLQFISNGIGSNPDAPHATLVLSIIVGQSVTVGGRTLEGVAPNATVYQTNCMDEDTTCSAINLLIDQEVSVINMSAGINTGSGYSAFDSEVDSIIGNSEVVMVVAAGNYLPDRNPNNYVASPGKAHNVISVGNAETIYEEEGTGIRYALSLPYNMRSSSSYVQDTYSVNKPDISAPGTYISYSDYSGHIESDSGTSFAAPIVAGVAAQMLQMRPNLLATGSTRCKSYLLTAAQPEKITTTDNPAVTTNGTLRKKSGAGFLNAYKAVFLTTNPTNYYMDMFLILNMPPVIIDDTDISYYPSYPLTGGRKIRATLAADERFGLNKYVMLSIYRVDTGTLVSTCSTTGRYNNVAIIECILPATGEYRFRAELFLMAGVSYYSSFFAITWQYVT